MSLREHLSMVSFRRRLAHVDAVPQLSLLALTCGALTGLVMVGFRLAIETPLGAFLPGDDEAFESLPRLWHFLLPATGGLVLGLAFQQLTPQRRLMGVAYVMERLSRHQGHLHWSNALSQFLAGVAALVSGQSGGREGPAVHLGAAVSSLVGQRLRLPNNSIRTLVGCGTAAAIAASFDTPLAGVVFAMEVVMMEYTVVSFIPVIIAAVTAAVVAALALGKDLAFAVPALEPSALSELPFVVLGGLVIGSFAAAFLAIARTCGRFQDRPVWLRFTGAGVATGAAALLAPEVLGIGYDTVDAALIGELGLAALLWIGVLKLLVSAISAGVGMPLGAIGPTLVIGAMLGGALGHFGAELWPEESSTTGFYVIVGMGAMMGAVLQAPLAALMAVLELTGNPNVTLPAMLAIVVAALTTSQLFRMPSLFQESLARRGLKLDADPFTLALQRVGVGSRMERRVQRAARRISLHEARELAEKNARWIVIDTDDGPEYVLAATDLARWVHAYDDQPPGTQEEDAQHGSDRPRGERGTPRGGTEVDLLAIPGLRKDAVLLQFQATLLEALNQLESSGREAVCVTRTSAPMISPIIGVLTREDIENYFRLKD